MKKLPFKTKSRRGKMDTKNRPTDLVHSAFFAALTAVLGLISIPIPMSPSPISAMSLGIMLTGSILTVRQAAFSVITLILMGAAGLPVFAGMSGGIGILLGPRGGYYFGFLIGVMLIAWLRGRQNRIWRLALANVTGGVMVVDLFGVVWLSFITDISLGNALIAGVLPFLLGDLVKAFIATWIGALVNRSLLRFKG